MPDLRKLAALPCGRRTKWIVLAFWIVVMVLAGPLSTKLTGAQKNDASSWLPKNAESTQVLNLSEKFVPKDVFPALVVYDRGEAPVTEADKAKAAADAKAFLNVTSKKVAKPVMKVEGPIPAGDGKALQTIVSIRVGSDGWDALPPVVKDIRKIADSNANGLEGRVTGPAGYAADFSEVFGGFDATLLIVTALIVIIILLITYRSPILWLMPLLCVGLALTAAQAVIYLLAKHAGLTVNGQSAFILTVLVFGAGTDYALLLIARYREELRRHEDRHEAMAIALYRAGPAIIASGATVALSLLCLLIAELNSTKSLGPVMAIGVTIGLAAMVTLLPALLTIFGRWLFWPKKPAYGSPEPTERGFWSRTGKAISGRPRITWVGTALILGVMALGMTDLNSQYLAGKDSFSSGKPESVTGEEIQSKHFPAGSASPIQVIGAASAKQALTTTLAAVPNVIDVKTPYPDRDGLTYVEGVLTLRADGSQAFKVLQTVRDKVHAIPAADAKTGGTTAVSYDIKKATTRDTKYVVPLVLLVVFTILAMLLRAVVAPIILVATVVLSFCAALGVSALVFDHVFGFAGTDISFPLWVFVFLVALGVDYNIFLMGRVHEEAKRFGTRRGALLGLSATGGVITSAGAVLAGTFAALGSLPLVFVTELGFAVAFGVLLDTFIVRSVLVTAITLDVGPRIWWPSRLSHETTTGTPAHPKYAPKEDQAAPASR